MLAISSFRGWEQAGVEESQWLVVESAINVLHEFYLHRERDREKNVIFIIILSSSSSDGRHVQPVHFAIRIHLGRVQSFTCSIPHQHQIMTIIMGHRDKGSSAALLQCQLGQNPKDSLRQFILGQSTHLLLDHQSLDRHSRDDDVIGER